MRKETLNGLTQKTHQIKKGDDPQFLALENIAVDSTLKVEVKKEVGRDDKLFNTINTLYLLEAQNKIQYYIQGDIMPLFQLATVKDTADVDVLVAKMAKIDLAYAGEISLNQNDTVDVLAANLKKIADSSMYTFEGTAVSNKVYEVKERIFKAEEQQRKIDLKSTDFLILDKSSLPSELEFRVNGQKITRTAEAILLHQADRFNVVGYDQNQNPIFGTYKAVVIDVRACTEVIMEDESDPRVDIKYHTVKTPYSNNSNKEL